MRTGPGLALDAVCHHPINRWPFVIARPASRASPGFSSPKEPGEITPTPELAPLPGGLDVPQHPERIAFMMQQTAAACHPPLPRLSRSALHSDLLFDPSQERAPAEAGSPPALPRVLSTVLSRISAEAL